MLNSLNILGVEMVSAKPNSDFKLMIRKRIILHTSDTELVLYEGRLAQEFGVSRTPIRQVLQALAAEWLVEVKVGVGTIAATMQHEHHDRDVSSFLAILLACAELSDTDPDKSKLDVLTSKMLFETRSKPIDGDSFFETAVVLATVLDGVVLDEILRDALTACYWRFVRRLLFRNNGNIQASLGTMDEIITNLKVEPTNPDASPILSSFKSSVEQVFPTISSASSGLELA